MGIKTWLFGKNKPKGEDKVVEAVAVADDDAFVPLHGAPATTIEDGKARIFRDSSQDRVDSFETVKTRAADSVEGVLRGKALDDSGFNKANMSSSPMSAQLQDWYMSTGFIGWQAMALIAQHWLIEKCCSMPAHDAVRNGYEIKVSDGQELPPEVLDKIRRLDSEMKVLKNCSELVKFTNVFGLRILMFKVDSDDPQYYEKPFNIDGVTRGAYKGMSQIDPYWIAPLLDNCDSSDPSAINFYNPTWWVINGKKIHRSHLHIGMGAAVPDILKPSYYYGGISLVQRIYERVYAAERTANEAPLLAMSKRTSILKVDLAKAALKFQSVAERLMEWISHRDNHGVKVIDKNEAMEQQDTSLADLDTVIMTQFQLVSSIAEVPATKLLGTSPKGFGAAGDYEELSYHEKLESIHSDLLDELVARHHLLLCKSHGINARIEAVWNPVGTKTPEQLAELNKKKAETGQILIMAGVLAPDEERQRIRTDKESGYANLSDDDADASLEPGFGGATASEVSPESAPNTPDAEVTDEHDDDAQQEDVEVAVEVRPMERKGPTVAQMKGTVQPSVKPSVKGIVGAGKEDGKAALLAQLQEVLSALTAIQGNGADADEGQFARMWEGFDCYIETPKGARRSGDGYVTESMPADYGYLNGYTDADGDSIDAFFGPDDEAQQVFVMDQINPETGEFDEHKVFIGFPSITEAQACYRAAYSADWKGEGVIVPMSILNFRYWVNRADLTRPIAETFDGLQSE
ncbi:head/portal protein [Aeromonas phage Gekk3-15]